MWSGKDMSQEMDRNRKITVKSQGSGAIPGDRGVKRINTEAPDGVCS